MGRKPPAPGSDAAKPAGSLAAFACPNPDCSHFNRFDAGNLSVVEWTGKHKHIRRLYCAMYRVFSLNTTDRVGVPSRFALER